MARIIKQIINFVKEQKLKKIVFRMNRNKKEVDINAGGSSRYRIKHGVNKGKVL